MITEKDFPSKEDFEALSSQGKRDRIEEYVRKTRAAEIEAVVSSGQAVGIDGLDQVVDTLVDTLVDGMVETVFTKLCSVIDRIDAQEAKNK